MRDVSDLLREADPLGYEQLPTSEERRLARQRVLDAPASRPRRPRRRIVAAAVLALALGGTVAGYWSRAAVELAAAVRFEVRLAEPVPGPGLREVALPGNGRVYLHQETIVSNGDIARADVT